MRMPSASIPQKTPPPPPPAHEAVIGDLRRPIPDAPAAGPVLTGLLAVATLGLLPAMLWPFRWSASVAAERKHYLALADWVRVNTGHPASAKLLRSAKALRAVPALSAVALGCGVALCALFVAAFIPLGPDAPLDCTYGFFAAGGETAFRGSHRLARYALTDLRRSMFLAWTGLLSLAYLGQWLQVQLHTRKVRNLLDAFNDVTLRDALAPVFLPPVGAGIRPLWSAVAVGMIVWGSALGPSRWRWPARCSGATRATPPRHSAPPWPRGCASWLRSARDRPVRPCRWCR